MMLICLFLSQHPQCQGIHTSRILFNSMAPNTGPVLHSVTEKGGGVYELDIGEAYGITTGAKFNSYALKGLSPQYLGILQAEKATAFTTELRLIPDATTSPSTFNSQPEHALQVCGGDDQDLWVYIADDDRLVDVYAYVM